MYFVCEAELVIRKTFIQKLEMVGQEGKVGLNNKDYILLCQLLKYHSLICSS